MPTATRSAMNSARPSRQSGSAGAVARARCAARCTPAAARAAAKSVGRARPDLAAERPPARRSPRANSNHEHCPPAGDVRRRPAGGSPRRARPARRARWPVNVGQPTWSSTTVSSSRSAASRRIVSGKHGPPAPNSHEERTIVCALGRGLGDRALAGELRASVRRTAGPIGSDSTYGSRLRAVEHVVARDVDRPRARAPPPPRATLPGAGAVDRQRRIGRGSRRRRRRSTRRS